MSELLPFLKCFKPLWLRAEGAERIQVPCGSCIACQNQKRQALSLKLHLEELNSAFTYFITLTYDNEHLPLYRLVDHDFLEGVLMPSPISDRIVSDFGNFEDSKDSPFIKQTSVLYDSIRHYNAQVRMHQFNRRVSVPYGNGTFALLYYRDAQLFIKRLRKYIDKYFHEKVRYYIIGEYGTSSLRPHWHLLLFFDSSALAREFEIVDQVGTASRPAECAHFLRSLWQYGIVDSKRTNKQAYYYVSSYVNKPASFPAVLDVLSKQKCYHSNCFGAVLSKETLIKFIKERNFDGFRNHFVTNSDGSQSAFALWRSYYDEFFPRFSGQRFCTSEETFGILSSYERLSNYFHSDSVAYLSKCLMFCHVNGEHSPSIDYFLHLFRYQIAMSERSNLDILSALQSAIRSSKKFMLYANILSLLPSAYYETYIKFYSYLDLHTLATHYQMCESDARYTQLYYDIVSQSVNSCSDDYMDTTEFKLMRSQEISKFNTSVKHRHQVDLINNSLYL